jgi:DNA-binding transcriptional LysR family regulator
MRVEPMFDWNDLRYFLAVARHGSLASAAAMLGVNQSTVQRRLRAMEMAVGCSLAQRRPEGYGLTAVGRDLLAHAEKVEASVADLQRKIVALDRAASGRAHHGTARPRSLQGRSRHRHTGRRGR